jgi:predicted nucleic-acid-binding protein
VTGQTPALAKQATALIEKTKTQLAVSDIAIIELVFVLEKLKKLRRDDIASVLEMLAGQKKLNFNRALFEAALPVYTAQPALSIHHSCLSVYADKNQVLSLWAFDKKLARQSPLAKLVG